MWNTQILQLFIINIWLEIIHKRYFKCRAVKFGTVISMIYENEGVEHEGMEVGFRIA